MAQQRSTLLRTKLPSNASICMEKFNAQKRREMNSPNKLWSRACKETIISIHGQEKISGNKWLIQSMSLEKVPEQITYKARAATA